MAALCENNEFHCSVCMENYTDPRKLPQCFHGFCAKCIKSLLSKSEEFGSFSCPVCRAVNRGPYSRKDIDEWIESLYKMETPAIHIDSVDADTTSEIQDKCDSCEDFGVSSKALRFCFDCFEAFCNPCFVGRHSFKPFKSHKVTEMGQGKVNALKKTDLIALRLLKQDIMCTKHSDKQLEFYCKDDDSYCCAVCVIMVHRKCLRLEMLNNKDTASGLDEVRHSCEKLFGFTKTLVDAINKSKEDNKTQLEVINKTLQESRERVNKLFDVLEGTVNINAKAITKKVSIAADHSTELLQRTLEELTMTLSILEKLSKLESFSHLSVILHRIHQKMKQYETVILDSHETFDNVVPVLQLQEKLQQFLDLSLNDTHKLATIVEENCHGLPSYQMQDLLKNCKVVKIAEKFVEQIGINSAQPKLSSINLLPNNYFLLIDTNNSCCILKNSKFETAGCNIISDDNCTNGDSLDLRSSTYFTDGTIAVCSPIQKKIYFLSADEGLSTIRATTTKYMPQVISSLPDDDIAIAWKDPVAFGIMSIKEKPEVKVHFCRDKSGRRLQWFNYMGVDILRKHIIQPCAVDKAIYSFTFEGLPKFKYTNSRLSYPGDVSLDGDGNVYALDCWLSNIHVISPTGKAVRVIQEECPMRPLAITFSKDGQKYAVTNNTGNCHVVSFYKLQSTN